MGWYQEFMGDEGDMPSKIYHMCPQDDWEKRPSKYNYFSANFEKEQVVRCTHQVERLVEIANCFYSSSSPADVPWVCLEINTMSLRMNGIETKMIESTLDKTLKCPHVYGGIPHEAVSRTYAVQRDPSTGQFLVVHQLTDVTCSLSKHKNSNNNKSSPTSSTLMEV